jgi:hypothetical protein
MDNERPENPNVREARRHARAAREEWRKSMEAWLPPGVAEHSRAARREFLLGIRSMINAAIDRLDRMDREEPKNTTGENTPPSSSTL